MGITYVKSDTISSAVAGTAAVVVDLGLGIDEAARILKVEMAAHVIPIFTANLLYNILGSYSFDPEDTVASLTDDEQFAMIEVVTSAILASTGAQKQSEVIFLDFANANLITTRNLALMVFATGGGGAVSGKVYYEKYKPAATELVQLIAQRR